MRLKSFLSAHTRVTPEAKPEAAQTQEKQTEAAQTQECPQKKWTEIICDHNPSLEDLMNRVESCEKTIEAMSADLKQYDPQSQDVQPLDLKKYNPYKRSLVKIKELLRSLDRVTLSAEDTDIVKTKKEEFEEKDEKFKDIMKAFSAWSREEQQKKALDEAMAAYVDEEKRAQSEGTPPEAVGAGGDQQKVDKFDLD